MRRQKQELVVEAIKLGRLFVNRNGIILKNFGAGNKRLSIPNRCESLNRSTGYYKVNFSISGRYVTCYSHQISYVYFNGVFDEKLTIDHVNAIKTDNNPTNLMVKTPGSQQRNNYKLGLTKISRGEDSGVSVLTKKAVIDIKEHCKPRDRKLGVSCFSRKYNVDPSTISKVLSGVSWSHIKV